MLVTIQKAESPEHRGKQSSWIKIYINCHLTQMGNSTVLTPPLPSGSPVPRNEQPSPQTTPNPRLWAGPGAWGCRSRAAPTSWEQNQAPSPQQGLAAVGPAVPSSISQGRLGGRVSKWYQQRENTFLSAPQGRVTKRNKEAGGRDGRRAGAALRRPPRHRDALPAAGRSVGCPRPAPSGASGCKRSLWCPARSPPGSTGSSPAPISAV